MFTWCLGGKQSHQRMLLYFLCNYLLTLVTLLFSILLFLLCIPWSIWVYQKRNEFQFNSRSNGISIWRLYRFYYQGTMQPILSMYWRMELSILRLYNDTQTSLPFPTTPNAREIQFTLLYIILWKCILVFPFSTIPIWIWGLGINYIMNTPSATFGNGALTVETLIYWTCFILAGFILGSVSCALVVHGSYYFYHKIFNSTESNESLGLLDQVTTLTYSSVVDTPIKPSMNVVDINLVKQQHPPPSAPEYAVDEDDYPPQKETQPPLPLTPPTPPMSPPIVSIEPTHALSSSPSSAPTPPQSPPHIVVDAEQFIEPPNTPPILYQRNSSKELEKLQDELKTIESSIEEYTNMLSKGPNNKLRRRLEKERKGFDERRCKLKETIATLEESSVTADYTPIATSRIITIIPTATAVDTPSDTYTYGSYIPSGTSFQPVVISPVFRSTDWGSSPIAYEPFMPTPELVYDSLSPTAASMTPSYSTSPQRTPVFRPPVYRSLYTTNTSTGDPVHMVAYAPPYVQPATTFNYAMWAFLASQRDEMHEEASAYEPSAVQMSRDILFPLRRGARAHISLTVPDGFELVDAATKALTWEGIQTSVQFQVACVGGSSTSAQALFKATIVLGTKVMTLRSYVFVSESTVKLLTEEPMMAPLQSELEMLEETFDEIPYQDLELQEIVGRGYFGDAYRAHYKGHEVVVKTIRASEFGDNTDQIVKEFRHEAAVLNMFGHHPNIVPFVGASTDPSSTLTLVTAYVPSGTIEDQYGSKLSVAKKTQILADAAAGLLNIHDGGFIHRDIAARNCLVDESFRTRICDFGMCRRVNYAFGGTHFTAGVGPLKYMAPESLQPPHSFTYKSDAYSFGVLMWETYAEIKPFGDLPPYLAAARVLEGGRLDIPSTIPQHQQELMIKCFQEDPSKRPSMHSILLTLLQEDRSL